MKVCRQDSVKASTGPLKERGKNGRATLREVKVKSKEARHRTYIARLSLGAYCDVLNNYVATRAVTSPTQRSTMQ